MERGSPFKIASPNERTHMKEYREGVGSGSRMVVCEELGKSGHGRNWRFVKGEKGREIEEDFFEAGLIGVGGEVGRRRSEDEGKGQREKEGGGKIRQFHRH